MKKKYILYKLIFIGLTLIISCGDEQEYFSELLQPADQNGARVKFIHAASDTAGANLFFNNIKITGNAFSKISTTGAVNPGTVTFQNSYPVTNYALAGSSSGMFSVIIPQIYTATDTFPEKTMSVADASITALKYYTVAFVGVTKNYETVVYEDDLSLAPINGKAYFRFANFIHNSTDNITVRVTPPVDPVLNPTPIPIILFEDVPFKEMTGFIELPQLGTYTSIQILNANTNQVLATLLPASNITSFTSNKVYTYFARGTIGGTPGISRMINR